LKFVMELIFLGGGGLGGREGGFFCLGGGGGGNPQHGTCFLSCFWFIEFLGGC